MDGTFPIKFENHAYSPKNQNPALYASRTFSNGRVWKRSVISVVAIVVSAITSDRERGIQIPIKMQSAMASEEFRQSQVRQRIREHVCGGE